MGSADRSRIASHRSCPHFWWRSVFGCGGWLAWWLLVGGLPAGVSIRVGVVGVGSKFAVHEDAVNVHASNLEVSESAMNAQAAGFLLAVEPLPQDWKGSSFSSWELLTAAWTAAMKDLNGALASIKGNVRNESPRQVRRLSFYSCYATSSADA